MSENKREQRLANLLQRVVGIVEQLVDGGELPPGVETDLRAWLDEAREEQAPGVRP
jgi:hypothetical protein